MFSWIMEYPETSVSVVVTLFCLVRVALLKRDFFSPISIYCFTQFLTLGISFLRLDPAMTDFHARTWMVWILGLVSFCGGCFLVTQYARSKRIPCDLSKPSPPEDYNWNIHLFLSFVAFLFFMVGVYGVVQKAGNLIVFTPSPADWMSKDVNYGYYAILLSSGPLAVLMFGVAAFKKFNNNALVCNISKIMVLLTIAMNLMAYPNRTSLFCNLGFLVIMSNFLYKRISPIIISLALIIAIGSFVAISSLRAQYGGSDIKGKAMDAVMKLPYMYVANNYWNLDYAINPANDDEIHPHTYGIDFFAGVFEYARVSGSFRNSFGWDDAFNEKIQKVYGFNTVNYLWEVYKDFHLVGCCLFPLLCGMALTLLHLRLCGKYSPRQIALYTLFIYFVGWWFFTAGYKQGLYCIWVAYIYFATTICAGRNRLVRVSTETKALPAEAPVLDKVDGQLQAQQ
ncbi:O-antigen polymerase [Fibrobacter sp. UWEL]|uniref:O-antigen polymerase n=1 Tax=Fibrobacter sp. UWEL TaxID=1896209 RepID=UPI000920F15A|nr:O-antigen polymerase [Fibrobacter sp. UWEL]SHL44242.1 oligosaccharide repeat unit polymerase [Fibrobacter sp. UWEL]